MSKTFSTVLTGAMITLIVLFAYALTTIVYSDTRDTRDREVGRTIEPDSTDSTSSPQASSPQAGSGQATSPPPSGGITSSTSGSANTGSNTGGQVTTGDEHVEVFEINIGPTNSPLEDPEPVEGPTPPVSEPPCGSDGRTRTTCPTDSTRAR